MEVSPQDQLDPELPDQVDAALQDLWHGSSARLENLLATDSPEGGAVSDVVDGLASGLDRVLPHLEAGSELGGLRIVREIGRGGMGVVYAAEQLHPRRMVALKVLRPGLASDGALRRFEHEARLLGRLRHPGIARIHEVGTAATPDGSQPYFVMELVEGQSLNEYAERAALDTAGKLELFRKVCDAVQHAHQRGVIHRDLKPANILVDDAGQPKILDFGVGRAVDVETLSMHTSAGQLVGTLPYMSPEQVGGDPDELDTRSDVYSLGVVLYELLSGKLPHDIRKLSLPEAARQIRDEETPALSSVSGEFRGDLDTIAAKAMAKDRDRRYPSAVALAEDISRHLRGEVIDAKRDSALYVLRKTLSRYRWPLIALSAFIVLLGAFTIYAMSQARRYQDLASRERQASHAAAAAERSADEQRQQAEAQANRADAVKAFLQMMLVTADPTHTETRDVTVREVLDDAAKRMEAGPLADQPEAEAEVRATIAHTYYHLGLYTSAIPHYERLHDYLVNEFGAEGREPLRILNLLAKNYTEVGRLETAKAAFERCLELAVSEHGDDHELTLAAMDGLGHVLMRMGRAAEAESLHLEALEGVEEVFGDEHELYVSTTFNLGGVYRTQGRLEDAERLYVEALKLAEQLHGESSYVTIRIRGRLAYDIYRRTGRMEKAEKLLRKTLDQARRELGVEHTETNITLVGLSRVLTAQGKTDDAEQLLRGAIADFREIRGIEGNDTLKVVSELAHMLVAREDHEDAARVLSAGIDRAILAHGDEHAKLAGWINAYAAILYGMGDFDAATAAARRALDIRLRLFGPEHEQIANGFQRVGWYLESAGDYGEAAEAYRRALELRRKISGETHRETIRSTITLTYAMILAGDDERAATDMLRERFTLVRAELGDTHSYTLWIARYLASVLSYVNRHAEAIALDHAMLDILTAQHGEDALETASWWRWLGIHLFNSGQAAKAVEPYRRTLSIYRVHEKQKTTVALETKRELAEVLTFAGEPEEAEVLARDALEGWREIDGDRSPQTPWTMVILGEVLVAGGKLDEAEPLLREALARADEWPMRAFYASALGGQARSVLGQCLADQGRYDEAEPLLLEGYKMLGAVEAMRAVPANNARARIVALYEAWGKPAKAGIWRSAAKH